MTERETKRLKMSEFPPLKNDLILRAAKGMCFGDDLMI